MKKVLEVLAMGVIAGLFGFALLMLVPSLKERPVGGTPFNLPAEIATSSTVQVGNKSVNVLIATTTSSFGASAVCSARIITTQGQSIQIVSPGVRKGPTGTSTLQDGNGHVQAASTTVAYNADEWGCGALIVMGAGATTTVTVTETRQ